MSRHPCVTAWYSTPRALWKRVAGGSRRIAPRRLRPARRGRRRTEEFSRVAVSGRPHRVVRLLTESETALASGQRSRDRRKELVGLFERGAVDVGDPPAPRGP